MSEKLYKCLLKLYPDHFRRAYGGEALRLVRDRARTEKGLLAGLRLWLDLLLDFAISLPREYCNTPQGGGHRSFQLLAESSLNPALLWLGAAATALSFWMCIHTVTHSNGFPALLSVPPSLQSHQEDAEPAPNPRSGDYAFCITASRDAPADSRQALLTFEFASPGASLVALIDGKAVRSFRMARRLAIRAHVSVGDHQFVLRLDRSARARLTSGNVQLGYCRPN